MLLKKTVYHKLVKNINIIDAINISELLKKLTKIPKNLKIEKKIPQLKKFYLNHGILVISFLKML